MATPTTQPRRIVRMSKLADHGYAFSVKTCYEWVALPVDPMPFIDMSKPGAKHTQYFVDLDELDAWIERRARRQVEAPALQPPTRRQRRSRAAECDALGIDREHAFA